MPSSFSLRLASFIAALGFLALFNFALGFRFGFNGWALAWSLLSGGALGFFGYNWVQKGKGW